MIIALPRNIKGHKEASVSMRYLSFKEDSSSNLGCMQLFNVRMHDT
jgi:hypothetical protein